jgi:large subunit ribosomal protein L18
MRLLKSKIPRAVVRKSLKHTTVQFIKYDYQGDLILASASSKELTKLGWNHSTSTLPAAYLTGLLAGNRAKKIKIESAVFDIGLNQPKKGSKIFSSLCGILDAGISVPHGKEILPDNDRISGKHISDTIPNDFETIKNKIKAEFSKTQTKEKDKQK